MIVDNVYKEVFTQLRNRLKEQDRDYIWLGDAVTLQAYSFDGTFVAIFQDGPEVIKVQAKTSAFLDFDEYEKVLDIFKTKHNVRFTYLF